MALMESAGAVGDELSGRMNDTERALATRSRMISEELEEKTLTLAAMLSARNSEISRMLEEEARPMLAQIGDGGTELARLLQVTTRDAAEKLRSENASLAAALGRRAKETIEALAQSSDSILGALDERAATTVGMVGEMRDQLQRDVGSLIGRLSQTSSSLRGLVEETASNLGAIDGILKESGARFAEDAESATNSISLSTRMLDSNVDRLDQLSLAAFSKIAAMADRFQQHGAVLTETVGLLEAREDGLRQVLDGGHVGLDELSANLVSRSEEIGGLMRGFEEVVNGLFDRTEQRSRLISERLAGDVGASLGDVENQLKDAEDRSVRTAASLKENIQSALDDAGSRFERSTEEIRQAAGTIRAELESARGEIKRGVFELPEETRTSTEAMRRAVSDQIRALRELSDIVSNSGRAFDVSDRSRPAQVRPQREERQIAADRSSEPARSYATAPALKAPAPEKAGFAFTDDDAFDVEKEIAASFMSDGNLARDLRGSNVEPTRNDQPKPDADVARTQGSAQPAASRPTAPATGLRPSAAAATPAAPAQAPARTGTGASGTSSAPAAQPARPARSEDKARPAPASTSERADADRGGGWVSNLLRRASQDEEHADDDLGKPQAPAQQPAVANRAAATPERSPDHVVESLNSLSMDIAKAIDHNASVELWDRYRRGERNVFTRRLYTMQGQQTFDDIRRKYQRDTEFRGAVDRYIADFEALLQDIARNDPENRVSRSYLSSDTGKVYTMLAHASGRFDT